MAQMIDLQTAAMTEAFKEAQIYAKTAIVRAWQVTPQAHRLLLEDGGDPARDIFISVGGGLTLRTFVMEGEGAGRHKKKECVRRLEVGDWVVTNPLQQEGDYPNRYAMGAETFSAKYESVRHSWLTVDGDQYRAKGIARILPNPIGEPIRARAPWGQVQEGGADCYVCASYNPARPDEVSTDRYILSANDFATYGLAEEVLGEDWKDQFRA